MADFNEFARRLAEAELKPGVWGRGLLVLVRSSRKTWDRSGVVFATVVSPGYNLLIYESSMMLSSLDQLSLSDTCQLPASQPSTQPVPTSTRLIPALPYELWAQILSLAAPPPSFDAWPARASPLLRLSLVSPSFRAIAQGLLLRHPVLPTPGALNLFLRTLEWHGEGSGDDADEALWRRSAVRSVRVGDRGASWVDGSREVGRVLSLCGRVEEVRLYQVGQIEIAQLAKGQGESI